MKNHNVLRLLVLIMALVMTLVIASCNKPHEHSWDAGKVTKEATCTEKGVKTFKCECGETKTEDIAALGHTEVEIPAVAATCTEAGKTAGKKCSVCETVTVAPADVAALGHNTAGKVDAKAATCTEAGVVGGTYCNRCDNGKAAAEAAIDALGHNTEGTVEHKDATCTEAGVVGGTYCTRCNEGKEAAEAAIEVLPHNTEGTVEHKDATCTENGVAGGTYCDACGKGKEAAETKLPVRNHKDENGDYYCDYEDCKAALCTDHDFETVSAIPATCIAPGLTEGKKCRICGYWDVEQEVVPATGDKHIPGAAATCTAAQTCTECGEVLAEKLDHTYGNVITTVAPANCTEVGIGTYKCINCDATKEVTITPRHNIVDGKCTVENCNFVVTKVDTISKYDANNDGDPDVFYFTNALPMKFAGEGVYHIDAVEDVLPSAVRGTNYIWYDEINNDSNPDTNMRFAHVYTNDAAKDLTTQWLDYQVYVDKAGVYDLAVHLRLKRSDNDRGARFIINRGEAEEKSYYATFTVDTDQATTATNDASDLSAYLCGLQVELKEGLNTIRITLAIKDDGTAEFTKKAWHFRNMYFVYDVCASEGLHTYGDIPTTIIPATCTGKGSEIYACTLCGAEKAVDSAALGHKAGEDGVCVNCKEYKQYELKWNDNKAAKVNTQNPPTSFYDISGWSVADWIDKDSLPEGTTLIVTAGVWVYPEMLVNKNQNNARPARFAGPVTVVMDDAWWGSYTTLALLCNSGSKSYIQIWVPVEGGTPSTHTHAYAVEETAAPTCVETGKWTLTCSCGDVDEKIILATGHAHPADLSKDNKCTVCGEVCEYPVIDTFNYDTNYLAPALPTKFNDAIVLTAMDAVNNPNNERGQDYIYYDEVVNTSGGNRFTNPDPFISVYVTGNEGAKIEFVVNVPETGVYEFAIHMRLSSNTQRGNKITVNEGTPNEQVFNFDMLLSSYDASTIRDNPNTLSAYLYGPSLKLNLVAGHNTITFSYITDEVWLSGNVSNSLYIRNIYLLKTDATWTPKHEHTWGEPQILDATCTEEGYKISACTDATCSVKMTEVIAPKGHTKGELLISNDPTCISQRENIYDCTACEEAIVELDASGANARLNHSLDESNKCTRCDVQFKAIDLGFTLGKEWDNQDIHALYTMKDSATKSSTKVFTTADIPVGSIIQIKEGYDAKIDGWDVIRKGLDNNNVGRCDISSYGERSFWTTEGDWSTQLDPTLGTRYSFFYFTITREDGAALTADDLAQALVVLVPAN